MWQTIETAPQDGSEVLCWDGTYIEIRYYTKKYDGMGWRRPGCDDLAGDKEPTHWMPLPTPPEAQGERK